MANEIPITEVNVSWCIDTVLDGNTSILLNCAIGNPSATEAKMVDRLEPTMVDHQSVLLMGYPMAATSAIIMMRLMEHQRHA